MVAGTGFAYDYEGQLTDGWYNALDPAGNFGNWTRKDPANSGAGNTRYDGFGFDALGNRTQNNYVASRGMTSFIRRTIAAS